MRWSIGVLLWLAVGFGGVLLGVALESSWNRAADERLATDLANVHTELRVLESTSGQAQENHDDLAGLVNGLQAETEQVDKMSNQVGSLTRYAVLLDSRLRKLEGK